MKKENWHFRNVLHKIRGCERDKVTVPGHFDSQVKQGEPAPASCPSRALRRLSLLSSNSFSHFGTSWASSSISNHQKFDTAHAVYFEVGTKWFVNQQVGWIIQNKHTLLCLNYCFSIHLNYLMILKNSQIYLDRERNEITSFEVKVIGFYQVWSGLPTVIILVNISNGSFGIFVIST